LVSIIVPNYSHAACLADRLAGIECQSYRHFEVIRLDDASTDVSQAILRSYQSRHPEHCHFVDNDRNSGLPFRQRQRGLELAKGELVWIAESDDFCDPDFLSKLVNCFANPAIMLAFCRSHFVDARGLNIIWSMQQCLPDFEPSTWERPLIGSAHQRVGKIWNRRNLIPNVSAALWRNCKAMPLLQDQQ